MLALSLSDKFCCFGIFVFVFNCLLFSRFSFHHFFVLVLVFVNKFIIFSFFTIFVFVNENYTEHEPVGLHWVKWPTYQFVDDQSKRLGEFFQFSPLFRSETQQFGHLTTTAADECGACSIVNTETKKSAMQYYYRLSSKATHPFEIK